MISVATDGTPAGSSGFGHVSADGRYVVFQSCASNLVFGDTNDTCDIFVRDRLFGTTEIVSLSSAGELANDGSTGGPTISDDGRFVAFSSIASNLVAGDANPRTTSSSETASTGRRFGSARQWAEATRTT